MMHTPKYVMATCSSRRKSLFSKNYQFWPCRSEPPRILVQVTRIYVVWTTTNENRETLMLSWQQPNLWSGFAGKYRYQFYNISNKNSLFKLVLKAAELCKGADKERTILNTTLYKPFLYLRNQRQLWIVNRDKKLLLYVYKNDVLTGFWGLQRKIARSKNLADK